MDEQDYQRLVRIIDDRIALKRPEIIREAVKASKQEFFASVGQHVIGRASWLKLLIILLAVCAYALYLTTHGAGSLSMLLP